MKEEPKAKDFVGCIAGLFWAVVYMPLWYCLVFGILLKIEADPWMWITFYAYVPVGLLCTCLSKLFDFMAGGAK